MEQGARVGKWCCVPQQINGDLYGQHLDRKTGILYLWQRIAASGTYAGRPLEITVFSTNGIGGLANHTTRGINDAGSGALSL